MPIGSKVDLNKCTVGVTRSAGLCYVYGEGHLHGNQLPAHEGSLLSCRTESVLCLYCITSLYAMAKFVRIWTTRESTLKQVVQATE